jgi:hypothetical protein
VKPDAPSSVTVLFKHSKVLQKRGFLLVGKNRASFFVAPLDIGQNHFKLSVTP